MEKLHMSRSLFGDYNHKTPHMNSQMETNWHVKYSMEMLKETKFFNLYLFHSNYSKNQLEINVSIDAN